MVLSGQLRAARALLGWSAQQLAERANVHLSTVQRMERCPGPVRGHIASLDAVVTALQRGGIDFVSENRGVGVMLSRSVRATSD